MNSSTYTSEPEDFTVAGILMSAPREQIPGIASTMKTFDSFLKKEDGNFKVDWPLYGRAKGIGRDNFTVVLIASGILSYQECQNFRIWEEGNQDQFLGPRLNGRWLFFSKTELNLAKEFVSEALPLILRFEGNGPNTAASIVQLIIPATYITMTDMGALADPASVSQA